MYIFALVYLETSVKSVTFVLLLPSTINARPEYMKEHARVGDNVGVIFSFFSHVCMIPPRQAMFV